MSRVKAFGLVLILAGCQDTISGNIIENNDIEEDEEGPVLTHDPITTAQVYGEDIYLEATVDDSETGDSGVATVEIFYRQETSVEFKSKAFSEVGGGLFQGRISGSDVGSGGMRYYLVGTDWSANSTCLPEGCEDETFHFSVVPAS